MSLGSFISGILGGQNSFQGAPIVTQDFVGPDNPIINNRLNQQTNTNNENTLGQMLLTRANGGGPSAADALLTQAMANNAAQASSVYSGNRSLNAGLAARAAANQQANANQAAAAQGAALRANEQNAATSQLQGLYGQMGTQALQGEGIEQSALANQNSAINQANSIAAGVAQNNANNSQAAGSGFLNGLASALASGASGGGGGAGAYRGGRIQKFSAGGAVNFDMAPTSTIDPQRGFGLAVTPGVWSGGGNGMASLGQALFQHFKSQNSPLSEPQIGNEFSTAEPSLGVDTNFSSPPIPDPYGTLSVSSANLEQPAMLRSRGGTVPGRAPVTGDSPRNDIVPTMLSPGEIVIPRSHAESSESAKKFIDVLMERESRKNPRMARGGRVPSYGAVLEAQANFHKRLRALEKKAG